MKTVTPIIAIVIGSIVGFVIQTLAIKTSLNPGIAAALSAILASVSAVLALLALIQAKRNKRNKRPPSKRVEGPKRQGTIKWFNSKKQFGFITTESGEDIFIHKRYINDKRVRMREGMRVEFSVSETEKGLQAEDVEVI